MLRLAITPVLFALVLATVQAGDLSRQHADSFQEKIVRIAVGNGRSAAPGTRRTPVSESEVNSWFAYHGQPLVPEGITEPRVSIVGQGRLGGRAIVDVDAIAKRRATGGVLDPWSYLGGRVPVAVTGILHTRDGVGRFQLETAEVSGIPVPKTLLQELVAHYSRTEDHPRGFNLDDPFDLPAGIRTIEVGRAQAVIVQ